MVFKDTVNVVKSEVFKPMTGADQGYLLTTAEFRLSKILGRGSLDVGVAL